MDAITWDCDNALDEPSNREDLQDDEIAAGGPVLLVSAKVQGDGRAVLERRVHRRTDDVHRLMRKMNSWFVTTR
jgi:hypothetical protein